MPWQDGHYKPQPHFGGCNASTWDTYYYYAILFSVLDIEATPMVTIKMASISQIFV
jgi:NADH:ubiquinone oxidoreductase subunit 3 (subunit A)